MATQTQPLTQDSIDLEAFVTMLSIPASELARLVNQVKACMPLVSESRYTLQGALLICDGATLQMVATDGHRLALASLPGCTSPKFRALLPLTLLKRIAKLKGTQLVELALSETHIRLRGATIDEVSSLLVGNFPDYERVIPKIKANDAIRLNRPELLSKLQALRTNLAKGDVEVKLSASESTLVLRVKVSAGVYETDSVPIGHLSRTSAWLMSIRFLIDALKALPKGDTIIMYPPDAYRAMTLVADGHKDECKVIIMPRRDLD